MRKFTAVLILSFIAVLLAACTSNETDKTKESEKLSPPPAAEVSKDENESVKEDDTDVSEENVTEETNDIHLSEFFLADGSKAHYEGEGNEFATLDIEVHKIGNQYVVIDENNGGVILRKLFRIDDDKISILSEDAVDMNVDLPSENALKGLKPVEIYLKKPLKEGTEFGDWKIIKTNAVVATPYKKFENAVVIEMVDNGFVNRKYLVPNYGEVKREAIMQGEENEDFIVTSTLETIE